MLFIHVLQYETLARIRCITCWMYTICNLVLFLCWRELDISADCSDPCSFSVRAAGNQIKHYTLYRAELFPRTSGSSEWQLSGCVLCSSYYCSYQQHYPQLWKALILSIKDVLMDSLYRGVSERLSLHLESRCSSRHLKTSTACHLADSACCRRQW